MTMKPAGVHTNCWRKPSACPNPSPKTRIDVSIPAMTTNRFAQLLTSAETERSKSRFKQARALFIQAAKQAPEPEAAAQALQGAADCARLLGDFPASPKA